MTKPRPNWVNLFIASFAKEETKELCTKMFSCEKLSKFSQLNTLNILLSLILRIRSNGYEMKKGCKTFFKKKGPSNGRTDRLLTTKFATKVSLA